MRTLDLNGDDGPSLIKVFSCEKCKYLSEAGALSKLPYSCFNPEIIKEYKSTMKIFNGSIGSEKITPFFCPFLFKKMRLEKINEINNINDRNQ